MVVAVVAVTEHPVMVAHDVVVSVLNLEELVVPSATQRVESVVVRAQLLTVLE